MQHRNVAGRDHQPLLFFREAFVGDANAIFTRRNRRKRKFSVLVRLALGGPFGRNSMQRYLRALDRPVRRIMHDPADISKDRRARRGGAKQQRDRKKEDTTPIHKLLLLWLK